jgi:sodium/hydrogen exchanger-like protein 3
MLLVNFVLLLSVIVGLSLATETHPRPVLDDDGGRHDPDGPADHDPAGDEHGEGGNHSEHGGHRYHVAAFDFQYVKMHLIVGIWVLYAGGAKIFFHWEKHLSKIFPESCMLILIGIGLGIILYFAGHSYYELNTTTFFLVLLPPIILDAGYFMPARPFFDQLGTILLYAVVGTLLNTIWLGFALWGVYEGGGFNNLESPLLLMHALVFGSLLAAVDPVAVLAVFDAIHVNDILYIVVFGESLLNDGISVVLYHVFEGFSEIGIENILGIDIVAGFASFFVIVFGATGIGMVLGLIGGFISRFTHHVRIMEPLIVFVIGYLSFLLAEMFHLSGILSCTFCGITMRKYVEANIGPKSKSTIKTLLKMAATCCEIIIFMYLGISAVSDTHHWDTAFCILTLVFCLIFRAIGVIILTYLANLIRVVKLTKIDQFIMAYGGLRGAIAFALVVLLDKDLFPHRRMFITTTVLVIYFTNLAMGTTIKPLVQFLKVKTADRSKPSMSEKMTKRFMDHVMAGIEDVADQQGHHLLRERFSYINNKYLKPLIVGRKNPQRRGWQIWSVYNRLNEKAAREVIRSVPSSASLTSLFRHASELDMARVFSSSQLSPQTTSMNRTGSFDSWIGPNGSVPYSGGGAGVAMGRTGTMDSLVCLDVSAFENNHRQRDFSSKPHHGSADGGHGPKLQSTKDQIKRNISREVTTTTSSPPPSSGSSTSGPRLYVPRRQAYSATVLTTDVDRVQSPDDGPQPMSPSSDITRTGKNVSFGPAGPKVKRQDEQSDVDEQLPGVITFKTHFDSEPTAGTNILAHASVLAPPSGAGSHGPVSSGTVGPTPGRTARPAPDHSSRPLAFSNEAFVSDDDAILVSPYEPSSSESSQETEDANTNNNNSNFRRRRSAAAAAAAAAAAVGAAASPPPPLPATPPPSRDAEHQRSRRMEAAAAAAAESHPAAETAVDRGRQQRGGNVDDDEGGSSTRVVVEMHEILPPTGWRST